MKHFGFDNAYKLYESLFDDTDDILNNNEIDHSDLFIDEEYIFERFTELYNEQDLSKYSIIKYPKFNKFKIQNINGIDYRFVNSVKSCGSYTLGYPKTVTHSGILSYIINSQELIDFIMKYNIIIQCPILFDDKYPESYITYIFDNINIPQNFLNNFSLYKKSLQKDSYGIRAYTPGLIFNNCNIIEDELESLLNSDSTDFIYNRIKYVNLNKVPLKSLNITIAQDFTFEIMNCNQLTDLNIMYKCNIVDNNSLVVKNCKSLKNVNIQDNSKYVSLLKLKIDKCPNINTDTLILPNHNTKSYNVQLYNDKMKQRDIRFRGDIVKWFYQNGKGNDFKYKYYDIGPNPHMYWL